MVSIRSLLMLRPNTATSVWATDGTMAILASTLLPVPMDTSDTVVVMVHTVATIVSTYTTLYQVSQHHHQLMCNVKQHFQNLSRRFVVVSREFRTLKDEIL
jgi:hypothetical protein